MQDRPDAAEILAALADFVEQELIPNLDGPLGYRSRVAGNLARILQREIKQGSNMLLRERERLCRLLDLGAEDLLPGPLAEQVEDLNQQLVSELERVDVSQRFLDETWAVLMANTRDKLEIVRPGYDAYDAAGELA